jgi:hypothetical protein
MHWRDYLQIQQTSDITYRHMILVDAQAIPESCVDLA